MSGRGLLTGVMLSLFVVAGFAQAQDYSVFSRKRPQLDRRYGLQFIGGDGQYAMDDVNAYVTDNQPVGNSTNVSGAVSWGFAMLYRTQKHFRWTIGYTALGQDKTEAAWTDSNGDQLNEQTVSGNEYYVMGSYMLTFGDRFHLALGAGPELVSGRLDRRSTSTTSVYNAHGRSLGGRAGVAAEFMFTKNFGLHLMGGYRAAKVSNLIYKDRSGTDTDLYWGNSNRKMTLDFSGVFLEGGIRVYFQPATGWFHM